MDPLLLKINSALGTASLAGGWLNAAKTVVELGIIGYAVIWTWGRIRGTQAERLVKGIIFLSVICVLTWILQMTLITAILQQLIPVAVVSLVIIFQPEIRRGLGYLGRTTFRVDFSLADSQRQRATEVIAHIISAVRELSRERTGALIVIEPPEGERDYLSPGTPMNADVSANLLLSIFVNKSPLHDGAAVIRADKIVAAGVILPITDNPKLSYRYGTRHRAAIGLSEIYDGLCIVVSEETGAISAANRGMLVRYETADGLADPLSYFYYESPAEHKTSSPFQAFLALFGAGKVVVREHSILGPKLTPNQTREIAINAESSREPATEQTSQVAEMPPEKDDPADLALPLDESATKLAFEEFEEQTPRPAPTHGKPDAERTFAE